MSRGNAFEGDAEHAVHVVIGVGGFKEADAVVVGVADEAVEAFLAEVALDGSIVGAGAEGEARDFDVRLAEGDEVGGAAGFSGERDGGEGGGCAGSGGGFEEIATGVAGHGSPPLDRVQVTGFRLQVTGGSVQGQETGDRLAEVRGDLQGGEGCNRIEVAIAVPDGNAVFDGDGGDEAIGGGANRASLIAAHTIEVRRREE